MSNQKPRLLILLRRQAGNKSFHLKPCSSWHGLTFEQPQYQRKPYEFLGDLLAAQCLLLIGCVTAVEVQRYAQ